MTTVARDEAFERASAVAARAEEVLARAAQPTLAVKASTVATLFEEAADGFRALSKWRRAAESYAAAADAGRRGGRELAAATLLVDAATCVARVDSGDAVAYWTRAVALFAGAARFGSAAALQLRIADALEADGAWEEAAGAWVYAADYFLGEDLYAPACRALARAADALTRVGLWADASARLERAAAYARDDNLLRFRVPRLLADAALCLVAAHELTEAEDVVARAEEDDDNFAVGRERRFVLDVISAVRRRDLDDFADRTWNFDHFAPFDSMQLRLLERAREAIVDGLQPVRPTTSMSDRSSSSDDDGRGAGGGR